MTMMRPDIRRDDPYPAAATALLLVDMQRIWLEPGRNPGHPDRGADHPFHRDVAARAATARNRFKVVSCASRSCDSASRATRSTSATVVGCTVEAGPDTSTMPMT